MTEKSLTPHPNQFIFPASEAYLFAVDELGLPFRLRSGVLEVVVVVDEAVFVHVVAEERFANRRGLEACVGAGLVEGDGVERGEHAEVRQDRGVVLAMAVAVRRDVDDERDVEAVASGYDGLGVFRHLGVQHADGLVVGEIDGVEVAGAEATAAAHAVLFVDMHLFRRLVEGESVVGALALAFLAAAAFAGLDDRLAVGVLVFLAGA